MIYGFCHAKKMDEGIMIMINYFVVQLADERRLALFPAGYIVKDPHHSEFLTRPEPEQSLHSGLLE